jgi:hypothetical protein
VSRDPRRRRIVASALVLAAVALSLYVWFIVRAVTGGPG